jgi:hypothetical protein
MPARNHYGTSNLFFVLSNQSSLDKLCSAGIYRGRHDKNIKSNIAAINQIEADRVVTFKENTIDRFLFANIDINSEDYACTSTQLGGVGDGVVIVLCRARI